MAEKVKIDAGFVKGGASKITMEDLRKVTENAEEIKSKVKGPLVKYFEEVKLLISMIKDYASGSYREIPWTTIAAVAFALIYIFSPIDIIPDVIPVLGLTDDALVLAVCLMLVEDDLVRYKAWKEA